MLGGAAATHVRPSVWFLLVCNSGCLVSRSPSARRNSTQPGRRRTAPAGDALVHAALAPASRRSRPRSDAGDVPDVGVRRVGRDARVARGERGSAGLAPKIALTARRPSGRPDMITGDGRMSVEHEIYE